VETVQGLIGKFEKRFTTRETSHTSHTFFGKSSTNWKHCRNVMLVNYVESHTEYGYVVSLNKWEFQKDGNVLRNLNCVSGA